MKSFWWKAGLFLVAVSSYCVAQSDAPSLGEAARQNRGEKRAKVVLSDQDLPVSPSAKTLQSTQAAVRGGATDASSTKAEPTTSTKDSSKAPAQAEEVPGSATAKQKLDFYKAEQEGWRTVAKRNEDLLATEKVPFRRQMYQDALDNNRKSITYYQDKIDELQSNASKQGTGSSGGK